MDSINDYVMQEAMAEVILRQQTHGLKLTIDTVIIELNGRHGGADVIVRGSILDGDRVSHSVEYVREV